MLQIMLCGAHDVGEIASPFTEVAHDFGAEAWFYQQGTIQHVNSRTSTWVENSRATVDKADICVFVILDRYGDITWNHELYLALQLGKPFVILALHTAWVRYNTLRYTITDTAAIRSEDDRKLVELLQMISSDYQLTITPFTYTSFKDSLRRELSGLFQAGIGFVQTHNQRAILLDALTTGAPLTREQVHQLIALATDEYESDKLARKSALRRLATDHVRDEELLRDVCRSQEQGIQRLGFDLVADLMTLPPTQETVHELAQIASHTDDVGIPRRLITAFGEIDATFSDLLLDEIGNVEEGVRRRAFEAVERDWDRVLTVWGPERMRLFLNSCEARAAARVRWIDRLRTRRDALS